MPNHYNTCNVSQCGDGAHVPPVCNCNDISTDIARKVVTLRDDWKHKRQHLFFSFQDFVIYKLAELSLCVTEHPG